MAKNICIIAGARPNFVKVSPLVRAIGQRQDAECLMVYAGREDDPTLEPSLFADLQMPRPQFYLGVDSTSLNEITSRVMAQFDAFLDAHPVDVVIVVDDLASTMAAAIVTKKQGILLAHIAAGTRSFDITMPKEINRLVIDGLPTVAGALTPAGQRTLRKILSKGGQFGLVAIASAARDQLVGDEFDLVTDLAVNAGAAIVSGGAVGDYHFLHISPDDPRGIAYLDDNESALVVDNRVTLFKRGGAL